jgi:hypothetical protein
MKEGFKSKSAGVLVALVFALCFGGVGAFTSWVVGKTLWDAWDASSWARVPAEVLSYESGRVQYRYEYNERSFLGDRIGIAAIDNDEGNAEAGSRIQRALNDKTPLEVLVDPEEPSRSVVDTTIPWTMVIGFLPFALGFGTVGLGALAVMVSLMLPQRPDDDEDEGIVSDAGSGFMALGIFAFLWNAIAFPIAAVMMMEVWKSGDWVVLFVLIFPLIGLLLIWGVINSAITWIRRGGARLHPQQMPPRLGGAFSGHIAFPRGVTAGDSFKARLSCTSSGKQGSGAITHWKGERAVRVAEVGGNRRLTFGFDTPDRIEGFERDAETQWQLDLIPEGQEASTFSFHFKMQPPAGVEHMSEEDLRASPMVGDDEELELAPAGIPKALEGVAALVGKERFEEKLRELPAAERAEMQARFEQMTPGQKDAIANVGKYAHYFPLVKKLFFWAIGLFILIQVIGVVSVLLFSS